MTLTNEVCVDDYLVPDFTLAQLKNLRRLQAYPTRNQASNSIYRILSLDDVLTNIKDL